MKKKKSYKRKRRKLPEVSAEERAAKLQATLDYLENKLEGNVDYIKKELPNKWVIRAKPKEEKKIKAEEKPVQKVVSKEKIDELQKTLDYLEKELGENIDYLQRELPKKWYTKEKLRKKEKEKPVKETKRVVSKRELEKLQQTAEHFEKKITENVEYIKKGYPKKLLLIGPSKLKKLIEERKKILDEIIATRNLLDSLEKERIRVEKEAVKRKTEEHTIQLQKFEHAIGEELIQNVNRFKIKKLRIIEPKSKAIKKKIPAVKPKKQVISEQELAKLQASLDKLNKELERIK